MPYIKLLDDAETSIEKLLDNNSLPKETRAVIETQRVMLAYLGVVHGDHKKVDIMWGFFVGVGGILSSAIIIYFFNMLVNSQ